MTILLAFSSLGVLAVPSMAEEPEQEMTRGEAELADMLEGRVAGEPERCIRHDSNSRITIVDGEALVFRVGRTLYVNRTAHPEALDDSDLLVIRRMSPASRLCSREHLETYSSGGHFLSGIIALSDFVPYRRVERTDG